LQKDLQFSKVLIAEDNLMNQKVLATLLEKWGYQTEIVSNGVEVLDQLRKDTFDAIIMDYQMPEMNGLQTIQAMRTAFDGKVNSIPVLFLTSEINPKALQQLEEYGIKYFIKKPIEPENLSHTLAQILKKANKPKRKIAAKVNYLKRITDGNRELMAEIIDLFIEEAPVNISKMKNLCLLEDWVGLRKIIHKTRSNFKYVSIEEYEDILRDFEIDLERQVNTETYLARIIALEQKTAEAIDRLKLKKNQLLGKI
jgi:CheY-like chemotaxis protein